jgi:hypothetical protein
VTAIYARWLELLPHLKPQPNAFRNNTEVEQVQVILILDSGTNYRLEQIKLVRSLISASGMAVAGLRHL